MNQIKIGSTEINVEDIHTDWVLSLMKNGIIVDLKLSRWRGTCSLKPEDLGIKFSNDESSKFAKRYLTWGNEKLLPPEISSELQNIESRARECLNNYSFDTIWGRFVPYRAFELWHKDNAALKKEYSAAALALCDRYPEVVITIQIEYAKLAKDVWKRLYPGAGEPTVGFVSDFVDKIIKKMPSQTEVLTSFKYDVAYLQLPMPSFLEQNMAYAAEIRRNDELKNAEHQTILRTKQLIAEEYITKKSQIIDEFLQSTVMGMRKYIGEICDNVLVSLTNQNDLDKFQTNKIKAMISKVNLLNFSDDTEIEKKLNELKFEVEKFKGERNKNAILGKLKQIVDISKQQIMPPNYNSLTGSISV